MRYPFYRQCCGSEFARIRIFWLDPIPDPKYGSGFRTRIQIRNKICKKEPFIQAKMKYWNLKQFYICACTPGVGTVSTQQAEHCPSCGNIRVEVPLFLIWWPVLWIHDILVWIRIRGSISLTNGSGSCFFRHRPARCQQKTYFLTQFFLLITLWMYIYIIFQR